MKKTSRKQKKKTLKIKMKNEDNLKKKKEDNLKINENGGQPKNRRLPQSKFLNFQVCVDQDVIFLMFKFALILSVQCIFFDFNFHFFGSLSRM